IIFAAGCSTSISLRIVTPSFVIVTSPNESTSILSIPRGPSVERTASATARAAAMLLFCAPLPRSRPVPSFRMIICWPCIIGGSPGSIEEDFYINASNLYRAVGRAIGDERWMTRDGVGGATPMCEGYWDRRTQRWVSLEELEERDEELATLLSAKIQLPPPATQPKRKPALA